MKGWRWSMGRKGSNMLRAIITVAISMAAASEAAHGGGGGGHVGLVPSNELTLAAHPKTLAFALLHSKSPFAGFGSGRIGLASVRPRGLCYPSRRIAETKTRMPLMSGNAKGKPSEGEQYSVEWEHGDGSKDETTAKKLDGSSGEKKPFLKKITDGMKNFFMGAKMDKQKLAALGASALLSYGWVSNFSHISCLIAAWVIHGKKTGLSPLDPNQWPAFLAVYAIFYAFQNVIRPARFAASIALSPFFDRMVETIRTKAQSLTGKNVNKPTAFGLTVFIVNVIGSFAYLGFGLLIATRVAGVPLLRTVAAV